MSTTFTLPSKPHSHLRGGGVSGGDLGITIALKVAAEKVRAKSLVDGIVARLDTGEDITINDYAVVMEMVEFCRENEGYFDLTTKDKTWGRFFKIDAVTACRTLIDNATKEIDTKGVCKLPYLGMPKWVQDKLTSLSDGMRLEGMFIVFAKAKKAA